MQFTSHYRSFAGRRSDNQDACGVVVAPDGLGIAACVADGVGGAYGGDVASRLAVKMFIEAMASELERDLEGLLHVIDEEVRHQAMQNPQLRRMASTLSGCRLKAGVLDGVHVGDSRIFLLRGRGIKQLTDDQTEVNRLYKEGLLSDPDAIAYPRANVLEGAIGSATCFPQRIRHELQSGDRILLTTDGVHDRITKAAMRDASHASNSVKDLCDNLIGAALTAGSSDNLTVVAIETDFDAK